MIRVRRPGMLTTVQDTGRRGHQRHGVTVAGALDDVAIRIANLLAGNDESAAGLEITMLGPVLDCADEYVMAIGGADPGARLDGRRVAPWRPFHAPRGSTLSFDGAAAGCRSYLAVGGGLDVPRVLGSRATDLGAGIGGVEGRALLAGDVLHVLPPPPAARQLLGEVRERRSRWGAGPRALPSYAADPVLRAIPGPELDRFTADAEPALFSEPYEVTSDSNRMGFRLRGRPLQLERAGDMISTPVAAGTVQVPPSGQPIVLMADRQTVGGYPRIAQVITVDLPVLAQARPGARVTFTRIDAAHAQALLLERERDLRMLADALRLRRPATT